MEALAYLHELHGDSLEDKKKYIEKGKTPGEDRYIYAGPISEHGTFPSIYMRRVSDLDKFEGTINTPAPNVFYSLNAFWRPSRKSVDVRHLRALYVDLDCYAVDKSPMDVLAEIESDYIGSRIPEPNVITFTGRGLNLIWFIEHAPKQALQHWTRVGSYLLRTLEPFGADPKCTTDVSRVFRMPGSINPKSGKQVELTLRHENRFALRDLHSLYTPWEDKQPKRNVVHMKPKGIDTAKGNGFTLRTLNKQRLQDIRTLQALRNAEGIAEGYRETAIMWHHYFVQCVTGSYDEAVKQTMYFNSKFIKPIPESKLKGIMDYSKKHSDDWLTAYANLQLKVKPRERVNNLGLLASNAKLIDMLGITQQEQRSMTTIIGKEEYRERERIRSMKNRRKSGQVERSEYLVEQAKKTDDKLEQLRTLLADNPKAKKTELAKELGIGRTYLYKLLSQI